MSAMPDFSHVRRLTEVRLDRPVSFKLYVTTKPIELSVRPATEVNVAYFNARLRAEASEQAFHAAQRGTLSVDAPLASRKIDVGLFADYVVVGWHDVVDASGAQVPFSPDAARELFEALGELFDEVRVFAKDRRNFTQEAIDARAVAKN